MLSSLLLRYTQAHGLDLTVIFFIGNFSLATVVLTLVEYKHIKTSSWELRMGLLFRACSVPTKEGAQCACHLGSAQRLTFNVCHLLGESGTGIPSSPSLMRSSVVPASQYPLFLLPHHFLPLPQGPISCFPIGNCRCFVPRSLPTVLYQ